MLQSIEILRGTPVRLTDGFVVLLSHSIQWRDSISIRPQLLPSNTFQSNLSFDAI
jgi:hypothetical protein